MSANTVAAGRSHDLTSSAKIFTPRAHPWDMLPFVSPPREGGIRDFWAPRSTGQYGYDCQLGAFYAQAALPFLRQLDDGPQLLRHIVVDLLDHGSKERDHGVIVGMFGVIGEALMQRASS